jgi:hypothetical protein
MCHPERSEGSAVSQHAAELQIPHFVRDDNCERVARANGMGGGSRRGFAVEFAGGRGGVFGGSSRLGLAA